MQTMYLWYQTHGLSSFCLTPFSNIHIPLSAQAPMYVFFWVCVSRGGCGCVWFRPTTGGLSRHSFLLSEWTVWDAPIWKKKQRVYAWVRTCIHLVTLLPFVSPPPHPVSHSPQHMRTAEQNVSWPQCHLNNTLWLWLLAQEFECNFKVTV